MSAESTFRAFLDSERIESLEPLYAYFDSLPPVATEAMLGEWEGGCFRTGHAGEKQLGAMGWIGKTFRGANDVDPIVVRGPDGARVANDVLGKASLRAVEYRGTVTATMVYDKQPIFDHFRRVSDSVVLGVMDRKGEESPLFFYLRRP